MKIVPQKTGYVTFFSLILLSLKRWEEKMSWELKMWPFHSSLLLFLKGRVVSAATSLLIQFFRWFGDQWESWQCAWFRSVKYRSIFQTHVYSHGYMLQWSSSMSSSDCSLNTNNKHMINYFTLQIIQKHESSTLNWNRLEEGGGNSRSRFCQFPLLQTSMLKMPFGTYILLKILWIYSFYLFCSYYSNKLFWPRNLAPCAFHWHLLRIGSRTAVIVKGISVKIFLLRVKTCSSQCLLCWLTVSGSWLADV